MRSGCLIAKLLSMSKLEIRLTSQNANKNGLLAFHCSFWTERSSIFNLRFSESDIDKKDL